MVRPVIGLIPLYDETKESYWMLPGYMQGLEAAGAAPVMLPLTADQAVLDRCLALCDGLLLTGGHDVGPALYGEAPLPECGAPCALRDQMEPYLIRKAAERDLPVLGICRGVQLLNAVFGGTLYQDLPTQRPGTVEHHMAPPYDRAVHRVEILPGTPLADILGAGPLAVNSYHHQAVKDAAPALRAAAVSEDGLTEALYLPGKRFFLGVQWHPEFSYRTDPAALRLLRAFTAAAAGTETE